MILNYDRKKVIFVAKVIINNEIPDISFEYIRVCKKSECASKMEIWVLRYAKQMST